ncbi:MAG: hypothetical protein CM1200mP18_23450 [Gammaproteobacteria bacterium]|nr:MAG: hypothetical protein CM1200mP18_23450 [Gammaproteobacteria bacterium]
MLEIAEKGVSAGCHEVLFTLGESLSYGIVLRARRWMRWVMSPQLTILAMAGRVVDQTGLLPHINAGILSADE